MPKAKKEPMGEPSVIYSKPNNNILYMMMGVITLFLVFITVKMFSLEKKINTAPAAGTAAAVQQESPLSVANLKKYAKELKLDTNKFNKCLDSGEKKTLVDADAKYGASLGVQGTPGFFVNGKFLGGAFPFTAFKEIIDKEISGSASALCSDYTDADLKSQCDETGTDQTKAFKVTPKEVDVSGMTGAGSKNPKVTIVEFSDFECPFCVRAYPNIRQVLNTYKNDVAVYFKQFPLTQIHPQAEKAAEASLCAGDQGKFWEWHDKIFTLETTQK